MVSFTVLWQAMRAGAKAVPAVTYAIGLAGIAAAIAFIRTLFGDVSLPAMMPLLIGAIIVMAVLALFASAVAPRTEEEDARRRRQRRRRLPDTPGEVFLWAVCIFVIVFMGFTVTAVGIGKPRAWAFLLLPREAAERSLATAVGGGDAPAEGYAYYGRLSERVASDGGKLEPADQSPFPRFQDIKVGARFKTLEQVNLREQPTRNAKSVLEQPIPTGRCVEILRAPGKPLIDLPPESGGWLFVRIVSCATNPAPTSTPTPRQTVIVVDSPAREDVMGSISGALSSLPGIVLDAEPRGTILDVRANDIADKHPAIVIAHWHTFRKVGAGPAGERTAESDLLTFLTLIAAKSASTRFVIYSSAFAASKAQSDATIRAAFLAAARRASPGVRAGDGERYLAVARTLSYVAWSPGDAVKQDEGKLARERDTLRQTVTSLLKSVAAPATS